MVKVRLRPGVDLCESSSLLTVKTLQARQRMSIMKLRASPDPECLKVYGISTVGSKNKVKLRLRPRYKWLKLEQLGEH
jgi:hypothetical protein